MMPLFQRNTYASQKLNANRPASTTWCTCILIKRSRRSMAQIRLRGVCWLPDCECCLCLFRRQLKLGHSSRDEIFHSGKGCVLLARVALGQATYVRPALKHTCAQENRRHRPHAFKSRNTGAELIFRNEP